MLSNYLDNLKNSIQWAQCQDDFDVLCLAKQSMEQLMMFVGTLSNDDQRKAHQHIDAVLPMEWPLWMEACRYSDIGAGPAQAIIYH